MQIVRIGDGSAARPPAELVGAKAANLARMAELGLPVPPAFVLPVDLCAAVVERDPRADADLRDGLREGIAYLEGATDRRFGDRRRPLLVSVRSGAARSMPGMLDTVLDVGCTLPAVRGLVRMTGNPRFAWDCRRRFLEAYAETVLELDPAPFAERLQRAVDGEDVDSECDLDSEALERIAADGLSLIDGQCEGLPDDPMDQLIEAARAVFRSWTGERACTYRRLQDLEHLRGTAVTVQCMVFGNGGPASGAGVAFSRDPSTGRAQPVIDVLFDAQGEDVVSGRRTPDSDTAIARVLPAVATELCDILQRLEAEFSDVQDVEFTIEDGKLWVLQTRAAKRTPQAAVRIAIDLVRERLISEEDAVRRLEGVKLDALVRRRWTGAADPVARGVGASAGLAAGRAAFDSQSAVRLASQGDPVILVRPDTSTSDVAGFAASAGIVTAVGGRTAHAALVARQMAKPCVVGCDRLTVDVAGAKACIPGATVNEGDWISMDGEGGAIYLGRREVVVERPKAELMEIERWRSRRCAQEQNSEDPAQP
jgi:pyruvate,orthophosphate dikinase